MEELDLRCQSEDSQLKGFSRYDETYWLSYFLEFVQTVSHSSFSNCARHIYRVSLVYKRQESKTF